MIDYTQDARMDTDATDADILDLIADLEHERVEIDIELRFKTEQTMRMCDYSPY